MKTPQVKALPGMTPLGLREKPVTKKVELDAYQMLAIETGLLTLARRGDMTKTARGQIENLRQLIMDADSVTIRTTRS